MNTIAKSWFRGLKNHHHRFDISVSHKEFHAEPWGVSLMADFLFLFNQCLTHCLNLIAWPE